MVGEAIGTNDLTSAVTAEAFVSKPNGDGLTLKELNGMERVMTGASGGFKLLNTANILYCGYNIAKLKFTSNGKVTYKNIIKPPTIKPPKHVGFLGRINQIWGKIKKWELGRRAAKIIERHPPVLEEGVVKPQINLESVEIPKIPKKPTVFKASGKK
jgi:hypothetical protein